MKITKLASALSLAFSAVSAQAVADEVFDDNVESIETIVVTGQKIDRSLKETPNSVAVLTAAEMNKQNIQQVSDIYAVIPNLAGDFTKGFSVRGVAQDSVSGGGNSYLVSMYLDGAPLPYRVVQNGGTSIWDLSQVEVFRGPQSTLQGRNALAGAIMLRSQDPSYEWNGKTRVKVGEYGQQEIAFAGGGAIIDDMLAFRIAAEDTQYDGDIYNTTRETDSNFREGQLLRAKLLFEPNENFTALLTASSNKNAQGPTWSLYAEGESAFDKTVYVNSPIWTKTDTSIYNLEMSLELNEQLSLQSITTYSDSDYGYNWDGDMQATQLSADQKYQRTDKGLSQELRLTYESDSIQAIVGAYYSDTDVDDQASGERLITLEAVGIPSLATVLMAPAEYGGFGLPESIANAVLPLYPTIDPIKLGLNSSIDQNVNTSAIYADLTWSITEQLDLLAGLRYDREEQTNAADNLYTVNNDLPDPTVLPEPLTQVVFGINSYLNSFAQAASGVEPPASTNFDAWLPKLGLSYHINDNITANLIFQQAYRSGGVGTNVAKSSIYTYDSEYTDNIELSLRSVLLDGQLMLNANVFYTEWTDQQVTVQISQSQYDRETENAGSSNVRGFELEAFYYPTSKLAITGGIGFARSEFTEFLSNGIDLAGRSFEDAPEWTANVALNYEFADGWTTNVSVNYAGSSYAYNSPETTLTPIKFALNNDPKNDARLLVNANVGYEWENYTIRLEARNLFDQAYISSYSSDADSLGTDDSNGQMDLGSPRQVSLSLQASF